MPGANLKKSFCSLKEENLKVLASKLGLEIASGDTLLLFFLPGSPRCIWSRQTTPFSEGHDVQ